MMILMISNKKSLSIIEKRDYLIGIFLLGIFISFISVSVTSYDWLDISVGVDLVNITGENNFTHLTINTDSPFDSLVFYMPFDINTSEAYDYSNYDNDGTIKNNASYTNSGLYGGAMSFNGGKGYVQIANSPSINLTGNFTISYWVNEAQVYASYGMIISKHLAKGGYMARTYNNRHYFGVFNSSGTYGGAGECYAVTTSAVGINKWVHVVGVFNGTSTIIYVNGVLNKTTACPAEFTFVGTTWDVYLGTYAENYFFFNGSIDEFMIFNTSLTSAQISSIYNNQSSRFAVSGTQAFSNQSKIDVPVGSSAVNVTSSLQNLSGSSINLTVGFYNGSWSYTSPQIFTGSNVFSIDSRTTNLTFNFTFYAGNSTNPFYSPILYGNLSYSLIKNVPNISFTSPTPSSNSITSNISINVSVDSDLDKYSFFDIDNALVGWWAMDDWNSTDIFDGSYYNNSAKINGNFVHSVGRWGNAIKLDGTTANYLSVNWSNIAKLNNSDLTFSAWIYMNNIATWNGIASSLNYQDGEFTGFEIIFRNVSATHNYIILRIGNGTAVGSVEYSSVDISALAPETWYHIAVTFNNDTKKITYYLDGEKLFWYDYSGDDIVLAPSNIFKIGYNAYAGTGFNGSIDDVMLFSRELNETEIEAIYNLTTDSFYKKFIRQDLGNYNITSYVVDYNGAKNSTTITNLTAINSGPEIIKSGYSHNNYTHYIAFSIKTDYGIYNKSNLYNNSQLNVISEYRVGDGDWVNISNSYGEFNYSEWKVFGDSISEYYTGNPTVFGWLYEADNVFDSGFIKYHTYTDYATGGYTCFQVYNDILTYATNDSKITLTCGTNDASSGLISTDMTIANYTAIFDFCKNHNISIYLTNVPPRNTSELTLSKIDTLNNWLVNYYNSTNNTGFIAGFSDVNTPLRNSTSGTINLSYSNDGTHPNDNGSLLWANTIWNEGFESKIFGGHYVKFNPPRIGVYDFRWNITDPSGGNTIYTLDDVFNITSEHIPPQITINSPLNQTYNVINLSFDISSNENLSFCLVSFNNFSTNYTMTLNSSLTGANYTNSTMPQGSSTAKFWCNDTANNINNTEQVSFTIDSIAPDVNVTYPLNITYNINVSALNYTSDGVSCWWSNNGGIWNSTSVTCGTNWTGLTSLEGSNTWTVYANDSIGNLNSSSITFFKDTIAPVIFPIYPSDSASSTETSWTFLFNVTDNNNVNCSLILDNSIANFNSSVNISGGTNSFTNSSSVGSHIWSINCTDFINNKANSSTRSFTISTSTVNLPSSGGGGFPVYSITSNQLENSYSVFLGVSWTLKFRINNESHELKIESIDNENKIATIIIYSEEQKITLLIGQEEKLDINNDNYYDIYIKVNNITSSKLNLTLKGIHEKIGIGEKQEENIDIPRDVSKDTTKKKTESFSKNYWTFISLALVVIIFFSVVLINLKKGKKKRVLK